MWLLCSYGIFGWFWMDFCYRYKKLINSFSFLYRYDLLQLQNMCTKFRSATCSGCEVMAVLDGFGWIFATGTKDWSILLVFLYRYDLLQLWNSHTKFLSATCSCCEVMAVLGGTGWIFATGMKNWSIFLFFYRYDLLQLRNLFTKFQSTTCRIYGSFRFWIDFC